MVLGDASELPSGRSFTDVWRGSVVLAEHTHDALRLRVLGQRGLGHGGDEISVDFGSHETVDSSLGVVVGGALHVVAERVQLVEERRFLIW
jgi:hypothetical protein